MVDSILYKKTCAKLKTLCSNFFGDLLPWPSLPWCRWYCSSKNVPTIARYLLRPQIQSAFIEPKAIRGIFVLWCSSLHALCKFTRLCALLSSSCSSHSAVRCIYAAVRYLRAYYRRYECWRPETAILWLKSPEQATLVFKPHTRFLLPHT